MLKPYAILVMLALMACLAQSIASSCPTANAAQPIVAIRY